MSKIDNTCTRNMFKSNDAIVAAIKAKDDLLAWCLAYDLVICTEPLSRKKVRNRTGIFGIMDECGEGDIELMYRGQDYKDLFHVIPYMFRGRDFDGFAKKTQLREKFNECHDFIADGDSAPLASVKTLVTQNVDDMEVHDPVTLLARTFMIERSGFYVYPVFPQLEPSAFVSSIAGARKAVRSHANLVDLVPAQEAPASVDEASEVAFKELCGIIGFDDNSDSDSIFVAVLQYVKSLCGSKTRQPLTAEEIVAAAKKRGSFGDVALTIFSQGMTAGYDLAVSRAEASA